LKIWANSGNHRVSMTEYNHDKKDWNGAVNSRSSAGPRVDSQALQDIIDVLSDPFQTSCDTCNGLGFIKSGQDCPTCEGSGKVLDDVFK